MCRTFDPLPYANPSGLDWDPLGLPTSTVKAPPGRAKGPALKPPAMRGAAGLAVVSVCTRPQIQFFGSVPFAAAMDVNAEVTAFTTCVPHVFGLTAKAGVTSSQKVPVASGVGNSFRTSARISAPVSPLNEEPVTAETTLKSSSKTLCNRLLRKAWKRKQPAEFFSVSASVTGALFGSAVVRPVGQS